MSNDVYPGLIRGLDVNVLKTPEFSTVVQRSPNFSEVRIVQSQNPRIHWVLTYNYLKDHYDDYSAYVPYSDFEELYGFFLARQGQFDDFLYLDPDDNFVGPAMIGSTPNPLATMQVVNDGVTYYTPLQIFYGGQFYYDVTDLNGAVMVYDAGLPQTAGVDYTLLGPGLSVAGLSFNSKYLRWTAPPTTPVTVQFSYFFRVRFEGDTLDFQRFLRGLFALGGPYDQMGSGSVKFMTCQTVSV